MKNNLGYIWGTVKKTKENEEKTGDFISKPPVFWRREEDLNPKKAISKYKKWLKICDFTAFYPYFNNLKIYFILVFWGIFGVQTSLILKFFCFS